MAKRTINCIDATDAATRAAEIGFPLDVLIPTIEVWIAGKNSGTDLHAENYAGTIAYHEALKTLREEGLRHGLEKLSRKGVQLCVCAKTRVAVVIAQGDSRTGDTKNLHIKPSTKYPRGPMSCSVLEAQLSLFPGEPSAKESPYEVWLLLLHMTPSGETLAELSHPSVIDIKESEDGTESGTILDWHERIFFGTFKSGPRITLPLPSDLSPTADVVVPVKKRA